MNEESIKSLISKHAIYVLVYDWVTKYIWMNVLIYLTHLTLSLLLLLLTIYQIICKDAAKKEGNCIEIDIHGSISYFHFHCSICISPICIFSTFPLQLPPYCLVLTMVTWSPSSIIKMLGNTNYQIVYKKFGTLLGYDFQKEKSLRVKCKK